MKNDSEKAWTQLKQAHLQLQTALKQEGGEIKIYNNAFCQGESFLEMLFYIVHYLEKKQNEREREGRVCMYRLGLKTQRALLFF